MDTKWINEPDRLISAYLQRPVRSYEEALKARDSARTSDNWSMRALPEPQSDSG